ncbi:hypothetical protein [Halorubellus sp. PRR65]|nr:hypothetical protein [Halorubellus sp. PRR65]
MTPSYATDDDPPDDHTPSQRPPTGTGTTTVAAPADVAPELHDPEDA